MVRTSTPAAMSSVAEKWRRFSMSAGVRVTRRLWLVLVGFSRVTLSSWAIETSMRRVPAFLDPGAEPVADGLDEVISAVGAGILARVEVDSQRAAGEFSDPSGAMRWL